MKTRMLVGVLAAALILAPSITRGLITDLGETILGRDGDAYWVETSHGLEKAFAISDYPASRYLRYIVPWENGEGVSIVLTREGFAIGKDIDPARLLASLLMMSYEQVTGREWPSQRRSANSLTREIQIHCLAINTPWWRETFPIDIGFDEKQWDW